MKNRFGKARHSSSVLVLLSTTLFLGGCPPPPPPPGYVTPTPTGTPPAVRPVDFGEVYIHTTKTAPNTVTWINTGGSAASVDRIDISGADAGSFAASPNTFTPATALNPNAASPAVTFTFSPTEVRDYTATATPHLTQANATAIGIRLDGAGRAQRALGALTFFGGNLAVGEYLNFRRWRVGTTSNPPRTFNLQNRSANAIAVTRVFQSSGGPNSTEGFTVTAPAAASFPVPANGSVQIQMTFTPPAFTRPPRQKIFTDGVTFQDAAGANLFGTALCGVGFYDPTPELPADPDIFCPPR